MVKCETCDKVIDEKNSWTLIGRDYDNPTHFCSDSCRMMFPYKKKSNKK